MKGVLRVADKRRRRPMAKKVRAIERRESALVSRSLQDMFLIFRRANQNQTISCERMWAKPLRSVSPVTEESLCGRRFWVPFQSWGVDLLCLQREPPFFPKVSFVCFEGLPGENPPFWSPRGIREVRSSSTTAALG